MKMTKQDLLFAIQGCINSYEGKHGRCKKQFRDLRKYDIEHIEFYTATKAKTLWIIIRGSDEWKDWGQNFDTDSVNLDLGYNMHKGFFEDTRIIFNKLKDMIKEYNKIMITGHSKGGSMTVCLAYLIASEWGIKKQVHGIAVAPAKCVNKKTAEFLRNDITTVINGEDYICKIPFWKFTHVGRVIRIGTMKPWFKIPFIRILGAMDHYPKLYLKNMEKANV